MLIHQAFRFSLLLFFLLLTSISLCQDSTDNQQIPSMMDSAAVTLPDISSPAEFDSTLNTETDSTLQIEAPEPKILQRLIQPLVLTVALGGLLYLLFTQRGR